MLLQYFLFKFCHSFLFFGQEVKVSLRPTHFTRKSSSNHDRFWVFNSWNFAPGIKSIRWWWGSNDGCTHLKHLKVTFIRKFSTVQGSSRHVAWQSQFATCSYFQFGVVSWQLYGKENLSPSGGNPAMFGMKRFEAALDADFSHPVLLTEVSSGFLSSKRCLQHVKPFFSFHPQIYALEVHCLIFLWLKTKAS